MKRIQFIKTFVLAVLLLFAQRAVAANYYWYSTGNTTFSTLANWSSTSGSYTGVAVLPASTDVVFFGAYSTINCNLTGSINVAGMQLSTGYTGTVSSNTGSLTHIIGTSGLIINAGTFSINLSTAVTVTISLAGNFNQTGGTFSCSNYSGSVINVNVDGDMISSGGTFTAGNSTFKLKKPGTATLTGSPAFYNLTFNPTAAVTWSIGSSPIVTGLLQYTGTFTVTLNTGTLNAQGDITIVSTLPSGGGGSATININGTGIQTLTGSAAAGNGRLPHVSIACGTLRIAGTPSVAGNWTYTSGTVDANYSSSNSNVIMCGTGDIDGQGSSSTMTFQNITIYASGTTPVRKLAGNLIVNRNLTINSGITLATGVASSSAFNINIGSAWSDAGTFTQIASPACTVTFDGGNYGAVSKTSATEIFTNLTINKTVNGMALLGPVQVNQIFTLTAGKVKTTSTNLLSLTATASVSGGNNTAFINGPMNKVGNTSFTFPVGDSISSTPFHPFLISIPTTITDGYTVQFKSISQTSGSALATTIASVNNCEHWTIQRSSPATGTTTITPGLNWNASCPNVNYAEMVVSSWNGSQWTNLGVASVNTASPQGSIIASTAIAFTNNTTIVPVLIAKKVVDHSYAALLNQATPGYYNTNGNILYFRYDEEYKDANSFISYQIIDVATNNPVTLFSNPTTSNVPVVYGTNAYKMDLYTGANTQLANGMYLLVVTNDKNETFQIMFNKN